MLAEYLQYAFIGLGIALGFGVAWYVSFRYEQGRRRAYEKMTPEQRREAEVFRRGVFRRR